MNVRKTCFMYLLDMTETFLLSCMFKDEIFPVMKKKNSNTVILNRYCCIFYEMKNIGSASIPS